MREYKCNVCLSTSTPSVIPEGDKVGLFCSECGAWIGWGSRKEGFDIMSSMNSLQKVQKDVENDINTDYKDVDSVLLRDMLFLGLSEEAGEVAGICKRMIRMYDRDKDKISIDHLAEELGDVLWYLAGVANYHDLSLSDIWQVNRKKLEERYGNRV